jgi:CRISPR/Cas system-associated endoribonuclease Cas2
LQQNYIKIRDKQFKPKYFAKLQYSVYFCKKNIMAHHIDTSALSPEEKAYHEYMEQGDNYMNIEIYRNAKKCYQKALALGLHNDEVKEKLSICNKTLKKESRSIIAVLAIACLAIGAVILFKVL